MSGVRAEQADQQQSLSDRSAFAFSIDPRCPLRHGLTHGAHCGRVRIQTGEKEDSWSCSYRGCTAAAAAALLAVGRSQADLSFLIRSMAVPAHLSGKQVRCLIRFPIYPEREKSIHVRRIHPTGDPYM